MSSPRYACRRWRLPLCLLSRQRFRSVMNAYICTINRAVHDRFFFQVSIQLLSSVPRNVSVDHAALFRPLLSVLLGKSAGPAERPPAPGPSSVAHLRAAGDDPGLQGVVPGMSKAYGGDAFYDHKVPPPSPLLPPTPHPLSRHGGNRVFSGTCLSSGSFSPRVNRCR